MISEKIPSLLYQLSISSSYQEGLILSRLVLESQGFKDTTISETFENKHWVLEVFSEHKNDIENLKKKFQHLKLSGIKISSKILKPNHWVTKWKDQWKPLRLTKKIDVIPYSYKDSYKTSKKVIFLDTVMSFGTGMHETTQLISQLIEDHSSQLSSFLDIGTGTGILTLVALKLGAKVTDAMDISPLSIEATKSNLKVNSLEARVFLGDISKLPTNQRYQMVAANLITNDLLNNRKKILSLVKPGGLLMVSGISLDNLKRLKDGFKDLPLTCRKVSKGKQWAALLYVKKM